MTESIKPMAATIPTIDDVTIYEPDKSLLVRVGVTNLDSIFTPQVIASGQKVIQDSSTQFTEETHRQAEELSQIYAQFKASSSFAFPIAAVIDLAFSLRACAGLAQYNLIASLAKSLFDYSKALMGKVSEKETAVIEWHVVSISQLLALKIKGDGGEMGKAILAEINRLRPE